MTSRADLGQVLATFRGSIRLIRGFALTFGAFFVLVVAYSYWKKGNPAEIIDTAAILLYVWAGTIALLVAFVKLHSTHIHEYGIDGRNFWSFPVRFKWSDIQGWRLDRSNGFSAVVLIEKDTNSEMWIFKDVFFSDQFQDQIRRFLSYPAPDVS